MIYGYARCSTNEERQDIDRQIRELKAAGAEEVVFEYAHGDARIKDAQMELMGKIESGDTIIVTEVTRLSRSVQQLCEIITQISQDAGRVKTTAEETRLLFSKLLILLINVRNVFTDEGFDIALLTFDRRKLREDVCIGVEIKLQCDSLRVRSDPRLFCR